MTWVLVLLMFKPALWAVSVSLSIFCIRCLVVEIRALSLSLLLLLFFYYYYYYYYYYYDHHHHHHQSLDSNCENITANLPDSRLEVMLVVVSFVCIHYSII